ncbi:MAG TPA: hypothetical protein VF299_05095, partial [Mycobacterium sp.]
MLIISLALALIGLAALVFAVVTSNAVVAWVCIGASSLGVLLLIVDALRERRQNRPARTAASPRVETEAGSESESESEVESEAGPADEAADQPEAEPEPEPEPGAASEPESAPEAGATADVAANSD